MKEGRELVMEIDVKPEQQRICTITNLLRQGGYNVKSTYGEGKGATYIEVEVDSEMEEMEKIAHFLEDRGYTDFKIGAVLCVAYNGFWNRKAIVYPVW